MLDFPLMQQLKLCVVDRIQPQINTLAVGVEDKVFSTKYCYQWGPADY